MSTSPSQIRSLFKISTRYLINTLKVLSFALIIFLLLVALFNTDYIQNWTKENIVNYVNKEYHQDIQVMSFYLDPIRGFKGSIIIKDHRKDTLLYAKEVQIGFLKSLWSIYSKKLQLDDLNIKTSVIKIIYYENDDLSNLEIFINKFKTDKAASNDKFQFHFKEFNLWDSKFLLSQSGTNTSIQLEKLSLVIDTLNTSINYFIIRKLLIDNPKIEIISNNTDTLADLKDKAIDTAKDSCDLGWAVYVDFININNALFDYKKNNQSKNLNFKNIYFSSRRIFLTNEIGQIDFINLNARGADDFFLKTSFIKNFRYNYNQLNIEQFKAETPRSVLDLKVRVDLKHKEGDALDYINSYYNLAIKESKIDPLDVNKFFSNTDFNKYINLKVNTPLNLKGEFYGKLNSIKGKSINLHYGPDFIFLGDLSARNLFEKDKELINLKVAQLQTSAFFIRNLFPNYNIPKTYDRFGNLSVKGQFDGYLNNFVAYANFNTDLGQIYSDIKVRLTKNDQTTSYSGIFKATHLNLGKLIDNPDFGFVNLNTEILNGVGLSRENIFANVDGKITSLEYRKYLYKDISINGNLNKDLFKGDISIIDDNINLNLHGNIIRKAGKMDIDVTSSIHHINLRELHLSNDSISYSGMMTCKFTGDYNKDFISFIDFHNSSFKINDNQYKINSFHLDLTSEKGITETKLASDLLDLHMKGEYDLLTFPEDIKNFMLSKYPQLLSDHPVKTTCEYHPSEAKGYVFIRNGNMFSSLLRLPVVANLADIDFFVDLRNDIFEIKSNRFDLSYKDYKTGKLSFNLSSKEKLNLILASDYIYNHSVPMAGNFKLTSDLEADKGHVSIQLFDTLNSKILINANFNAKLNDKSFSINLINKDLFFNNTRWVVKEQNQILKSQEYFSISDLDLTDSIHFISLRDVENKGLSLHTDGFDISFVNQFIRNKELSFSGLFASSLQVENLKTLDGISGHVEVFQLHFNKDNFGPFRIGIKSNKANSPWEVNVENVFQEHYIRGTGTFNIPLKKQNYTYVPYDFNLDFDLKSFPLRFLENFISTISQTTGGGNGKLNFYSRNHKLFLTGNLNVHNGSTIINYLGVPIHFEDQLVSFKESYIDFDGLQLKDKFNNPITVKGKLFHSHFSDFTADIQLKSDKALILDTKKTENLYYYGFGIGEFEARFKGPLSSLDMDVRVTSLKGTKINIPVQYDEIANESKFVKFQNHTEFSSQPIKEVHQGISGLNLNMELSMTEDAETAIIFDELAGDVLKGTGRGNLQIRSLRNGLFTVNGTYEVEQGQYLFTLFNNLVNKPFTIKRGGTITWTGDPLNAFINLEAVYEGLYASPYLLLEEYLDESLKEEAKQRTDVKLNMQLTGSLLKPDIKFDIDLPNLTGQLKSIADNKIRYLRNNQDQLNQQVFGLLVLRTFLNNRSLTESNINLLGTTINTMSEMLSNQLSLFVSSLLSNAFDDVNFISGVDFNIGYDLDNSGIRDINSPSTNLTKGELVVSLKQRLLNDRLIFTVGGNYNSNSTIYGNTNFNPESVIEWNTPLPGLKMRVYYKGDESIEGIKHKIGTGVNYRKEFDSFSKSRKQTKREKQ